MKNCFGKISLLKNLMIFILNHVVQLIYSFPFTLTANFLCSLLFSVYLLHSMWLSVNHTSLYNL